MSRLLLGTLALALSTTPVAAQTVAGGASHSVVVRESDGAVFAFGYNWKGQLGDNSVISRGIPVQVQGLTGVKITAGAAGSLHTLGLSDTGVVYSWGDNTLGQLGDPSVTSYRMVPAAVPGLTGVVGVAAGENHSMAWDS